MSFLSLKSAFLAAAMLAASTAIVVAQVTPVVYNRGNDTDPETLDPHRTSTISESHILRDLFEGLVIYDAAGNLIPGAAIDWTVSEDGLTYTFALRPGAMWSNGDPVVADDFVFSYRRIMDPATAAEYANVLYPIKNGEAVNKGEMPVDQLGVRAVDAGTLEITLQNPTPYFLQLLTHQTSYPLHPGNVAEFGDEFVRPGNLISNGPYTLGENIPNDHITLVKNPNFYDAANVQIDQVVYYPMQDRSACLRRFEAGEIHSCSDVPTEQMDYIKANLGERFRNVPYLGTYYYAIDTREAPWSDVKVRQALSMAIDRDYLAEDLWANAMVPAYSLVPPGIDNYGDAVLADFADLPMLDRIDAAKALLAEAGFGPGNPLKVEIRHNVGENHARTATAIVGMWAELGVETTVIAVEGASYYPYLQQGGAFQIARAGWIADYADPQNFLFMLQTDNPTFNYAHYSNADYDAAMAKAATIVDLDERAAVLAEAEALITRDQPFVPLLHYGSLSLVSDKLVGWEDNLNNRHPSRFMQIVD